MEDYKKKYEDAFERAKDCHIDGLALHQPVKAVIEHIFPEFKESEDEKIRKALVKYLEALDDEDIRYGVSFKEMRSWLEKQKRHNPLSKDEEYTLARIIEYLEDNGCPSKWKDLLYDVYALPYQKERKPAEWSEGDERICQCLIKNQEKALNEVKNDKCGHSEIISDLKEMYRERIDWLKSLKERMKGE